MKNRIVIGYVIQCYDDHGKPSSQSFVAGEESWEDDNAGETIEQPDNVTKLMELDMVQPEDLDKAVAKHIEDNDLGGPGRV